MDILVQTKLMLPPPQSDLVPRRQLIDRLNEAAGCRLILVSAPAGFGKSTLIAAWSQQVEHAVVWLALDELDDEPLRFWRYITAALAKRVPSLAEQSGEWFTAPDASVGRSIPGLLVNALVGLPHNLTMILDDYHLLSDPTIHSGLDFLLDHLPTQIQLVMISRTDPPLALPRLRARNQLCELRIDDLRFAHHESARFLRERMGLELDERAIETLGARTEGWVAGLQFTGLSLQKLANAQEIQQFITELSGRDRHIVDYLMTEVLDRQPAPLQQFLLQTSILERLSAPLCNTVLKRTDAQQILDELERANLFVVALDNERHWYRYHHLFAELLRDRLQQRQSERERFQLHQRAHCWYVEAGMVDAAVDHALAAGDERAAAALLAPQIYTKDSWRNSAFLRIRRWVDQLSDDVLEAYPRLAYAALEAHLLTYRIDHAERYRQLLDSMPAVPDDVTTLLMAIQANFLRVQGKNEPAKALLREAMAMAPEEDLYVQVSVKQQMAMLLCEAEAVEEGIQLLHEVVDLANAMNHPYTGLIAAGYLGLLITGQGELRRAQTFIEQRLAQAEQQQIEITVTTSLLYIGLSILHYEWNDLDRARAYCERGLAQSELAELGDMLWQGYQVQALLAFQRNDAEELNQLLEKVYQLMKRITALPIIDTLRRYYDTFVTDIALRRGEWETVARWVQQYPLAIAEHDEIDTLYWYLYELYIRFTLAVNWAAPSSTVYVDMMPSLTQITSLLERLIRHIERKGLGQASIRLRNLLAQTHWLLGDTDAAFQQLTATLTLAQPEGYIRTFLDDGEPMQTMLLAYRVQLTTGGAIGEGQVMPTTPIYLDQLLRAFAQEQGSSGKAEAKPAIGTISVLGEDHSPDDGLNSALVEPLTERELEVLQRIIDGLTNQEIASALIISVGTVKRHISNIYGKLGVNHRTQAVARAQELRLMI